MPTNYVVAGTSDGATSTLLPVRTNVKWSPRTANPSVAAEGKAPSRRSTLDSHDFAQMALSAAPQPTRKSVCLNRFFWGLVCISYMSLLLASAQRVNHVLEDPDIPPMVLAGTVGGSFMCLTVPVAMFQIMMHLSHFVDPRAQSHICRIIFMVPLYSVGAFLSLQHPRWALFICTAREYYEAYVVYCFFYLLCHMCEDASGSCESWLESKPKSMGKHYPPFCCLPDWTMGEHFLRRCQQGVFQYVMVRFLTLWVSLALELQEQCSEGEFSVKKGYLWITVITCVSQTWALYVLLMFYRATHKDYGLHVMGKFLAIKSIVFLSWWQGIFIELLLYMGIIQQEGAQATKHVAQGMQDLLISIEMCVAAFAFLFVFPVRDFEEHAIQTTTGRLGDLSPRLHHLSPPLPILHAIQLTLIPAELQKDWTGWINRLAMRVSAVAKRRRERPPGQSPRVPGVRL